MWGAPAGRKAAHGQKRVPQLHLSLTNAQICSLDGAATARKSVRMPPAKALPTAAPAPGGFLPPPRGQERRWLQSSEQDHEGYLQTALPASAGCPPTRAHGARVAECPRNSSRSSPALPRDPIGPQTPLCDPNPAVPARRDAGGGAGAALRWDLLQLLRHGVLPVASQVTERASRASGQSCLRCCIRA